MRNITHLVGSLEAELKDLQFMHKQGYITEGTRGNSQTKGQLRATIERALFTFLELKEELANARQ